MLLRVKFCFCILSLEYTVILERYSFLRRVLVIKSA
nr:MAG TPA: hypothetical protein [Caudoviricetes sp.]